MDAIITRSGALRGELTVPGDKSISHRAVMCAALADGVTRIEQFLSADDCRRTLAAFRAWGVAVSLDEASRTVMVEGRGAQSFTAAAEPIDAGNSGTTLRLLSGVAAGLPFTTTLTGDASLMRRPMRRVVDPLTAMGACITGRDDPERPGDVFPPLTIVGGPLHPITYTVPVASAQVKSAMLFAALATNGVTMVTEPLTSRDHTERMLRAFGVAVQTRETTVTITATAGALRTPGRLIVPGDISSAAFWLVAGSIVPKSTITLKDVGLNPTRTGILDLLRYMGAAVKAERTEEQWEPRGLITVKAAELRATIIKETIVPRAIDELPVLMVAATQAEGVTEFHGIGELRVKETDRVQSMMEGLSRMGAKIGLRHASELPAGAPPRGEPGKDAIVIEGPSALHGAEVESCGDHRTAMSLAVAALVATGTTTIKGVEMVDTSYPGFFEDLRRLGADVQLQG